MESGRVTCIGIDTGGTFTDAVRWGPDGRRSAKVPSTPQDPARAVRRALEAVGGLPTGGRLRHGSTVATNAVLTRRGAKVVFLTSAGFEDLLRLDRGQRDDLHALQPARAAPLVPAALCLGVHERQDADGCEVQALDDDALRRLVTEVEAHEPEAIAICLVHGARHPGHEEALTDALRDAGLRASLHVSSRLAADPREAERGRTVVLDAYVGPRVGAYVSRLAADLPPGSLTVMRSDGGRMPVEEVRRAPVRTLLSGPAGGVAAAHAEAVRLGLERALSFDMGGTSTDVAWIEGDDLPVREELVVGEHRASVPSLAIETVGAGGGSEVYVDAGGALRVGPRSAGADPGPACYGHGGPFTLTDAWLVLGRLPDALLDGAFPLDHDAATRAGEVLATEAGLDLDALAEGAVRMAAATTARALRRASVQQGHDPRGAWLVAFGGAGPMLAAETADLLDLAGVVVPPDPGTFAATGTLAAPLRADESRVVGRVDPAGLAELATELGEAVRARLGSEGALAVRLKAELDARYEGQAFEVTVPVQAGWRAAFDERHEDLYGFSDETRPVEVVRVRVRGWGDDVTSAEVSCDRRGGHDAGDVVAGPAIVGEMSATTWIPAGWAARVEPSGALRLERTS